MPETSGATARPAPRWRGSAVPSAVLAFVAVLGMLPYVEFARAQGSLREFVSAFDEATYLLGDTSTPYRYLSEAAVEVIAAVTPGGVAGLLIAADILIPVVVAAAAWLLVRNLVQHDGLRVLCVLLLLFGQELFSVANSIVWPRNAIETLQELYPPTTTKLIPDATTSYFGLFRTPEPGVSWVLLFTFLALVSRDPLRAFDHPRRLATYTIFAVLGFAYPFISVPVVLLTTAILAWALVHERGHARAIGGALLLGVGSFALAALVSAIGDPVSGTSVLFQSRYPTVTPAVAAGLIVVAAATLGYRGEVVRRLDLLVPVTAALIPVVATNQQLLTGRMVSARDWERYANYQLVLFSVLCLATTVLRDRWAASRPESRLNVVGAAGWAVAAVLGVLLLGWQRDVYAAWAPTNAAAQDTARLIDSARNGSDGRAGGAGKRRPHAPRSPAHRRRASFPGRLHATVPGAGAELLGRHPAQPARATSRGALRPRASARLDARATGAATPPGGRGRRWRVLLRVRLALADVWPPLTDGRGLRRSEALRRLPLVTAAYRAYLADRERDPPAAALVVSGAAPAGLGDGRVNTLLDTSPNSLLGVYLQRWPRE